MQVRVNVNGLLTIHLVNLTAQFAFTRTLTCITHNLYYYYIIVLPLPTLCPLILYGIRATLFWLVIVVLCSLSLRLCLPETLVICCCVPFLPSLAPP